MYNHMIVTIRQRKLTSKSYTRLSLDYNNDEIADTTLLYEDERFDLTIEGWPDDSFCTFELLQTAMCTEYKSLIALLSQLDVIYDVFAENGYLILFKNTLSTEKGHCWHKLADKSGCQRKYKMKYMTTQESVVFGKKTTKAD
jgi:hypothetical protein